MKLFRAKKTFSVVTILGKSRREYEGVIHEGQTFLIEDTEKLPGKVIYESGNISNFYEEIVPNHILVKQFSKFIKAEELP